VHSMPFLSSTGKRLPRVVTIILTPGLCFQTG
jgi:hypothetical protein